MAISVQRRGDKHQLRVTHRLLAKPFFFTFPTEAEARSYGQQLHALLQRGVVPAELLTPARGPDDPLLVEVVRAYVRSAPALTRSDDALLGHMLKELVGVRVSGVTYAWAEDYVRRLKLQRRLAPSSIRKRVGVLGRVLDWHLRTTTPAATTPPANALRLLPEGYSTYTEAEARQLDAAGHQAPTSRARDRRLHPDEEQRVRAALAGEKRPDRERALQADPALVMLFDLILWTGLRLSEAYRLRTDQVDVARRLIHVQGTKGHRGQVKPRVVPIRAELLPALTAWCRSRIGLLFPTLWDGTEDGRRLASQRLSARFAVLFDYAQVPGITEHDLRHEATCRWIELRRPDGAWVFSELEVCRIMGWTSTQMLLRYASLRGEDLAARLHGPAAAGKAA